MTTITTWLNRGTAAAADAGPASSSPRAEVSHAAAAITAGTRPAVLLLMYASRARIRSGGEPRSRCQCPGTPGGASALTRKVGRTYRWGNPRPGAGAGETPGVTFAFPRRPGPPRTARTAARPPRRPGR